MRIEFPIALRPDRPVGILLLARGNAAASAAAQQIPSGPGFSWGGGDTEAQQSSDGRRRRLVLIGGSVAVLLVALLAAAVMFRIANSNPQPLKARTPWSILPTGSSTGMQMSRSTPLATAAEFSKATWSQGTFQAVVG